MGAISPNPRHRQSAHTDPPEPSAPEGFLFSGAARSKCLKNTGDPDPGARARFRARSASAGPAGGNGASDRGPPMAGRTKEGSLRRRAIFESAARLFVLKFFRMVMRFDTSFGSKAFGPSKHKCSPGNLFPGGEGAGCIVCHTTAARPIRLRRFPLSLSPHTLRAGLPAVARSVTQSAYAKASADNLRSLRERRLVVKISDTSHRKR
jgi:hypothetical protein